MSSVVDITAFKFQPFSLKQKKLLTWWLPSSPYCNYRTLIADGAIRSGKTIACIDSFFTWSISSFKGQNFILAGKSIGALKRNVVKPALQILNAKGIPYSYIRSGPDPRLDIGSNSYYLFGANNEASQDTLQGLTAAGCYGDEVALFPESFLNQMIGRCSVDGFRHFLNCNPQGPWHNIKTEYIDKAKEKRILRLSFSLDDNLTLSEEIKDAYRRMFSGVFYLRNILGQWVMAEGVIYPDFSESAHCIAIDELPDEFEKIVIGGDYGITNPQVYLKAGIKHINGKPHIFVFDEYYNDGKDGTKTDPALYEDYIKFIGNDVINTSIWDPSASSFINLLKKEHRVKAANNSVLNGIGTVSMFLREKRLHIVGSKCPNLIKEFGSYVWDTKNQKLGIDEPLKDRDHASDALRYIIFTLFPLKYNIAQAPDGNTSSSRWKL